ncbi:type I-F CRISPR-associated protein Csy2 [Pseudoalteromonas sp. RB2-MNA-CIBAN-0110]|uniref:type I-F CRISPR-associated protein Csy2 n=1 Tax=Pseudoalteromonas sp. RB2-MNA-CIBAN-0110 TaxID=3140439 RepID=UPI0033267195
MHLKELLEITDITERDRLLRRAFSPYTAMIDITGSEATALIILLNLTYRKNQVDDLLDKQLAKQALKSEDHINKCIKEIAWFHTHNLKYPDIRVSKQNLAVEPPLLHSYVLSSANYHKAYGWSHDSAKVNVAKLFISYFKWEDEDCCLAQALATYSNNWKAAFTSLGLSVKAYKSLCGTVKGELYEEVIPDSIDRYSRQVRIPYYDGYVAVTPVISHVVQSKIQQAAIEKQARFTKLEFTRPASVSMLAASLGGVVNVLNYPPDIRTKYHGLSNSRQFKLKNGQTVFNVEALLKPELIKALEGIIFSNNALALKQRRQQKVKSIKEVRSTLLEWFSPVFEWRLDFIENGGDLEELESTSDQLEYKILSLPDDELSSLTIPLFRLLNEMLGSVSMTQRYAFHPKLMSPLKAALQWLLINLTNQKNELIEEDDEHYRYLHLSGIRVFDAQALSNPYCSGVPSLTAVWGMLHSYQRKLNEALGTNVRFTSFSWFIRDYSTVAGKKLPELSLQGAQQNKLKRPGIIDGKYCDLIFDLIIHIDGYEDDLQAVDSEPDILKAHFPSNFAGGVMHQPELNSNIDWCCLYSNENQLFEKLRRLPLSGCWVMPTDHKIEDLDELLLLLNSDSNLSPSMMGYMLLTEPMARVGALEKLHCYAEPAIGVVKYETAISIRLKGISNYFKTSFWMLDAREKFMLMKKV